MHVKKGAELIYNHDVLKKKSGYTVVHKVLDNANTQIGCSVLSSDGTYEGLSAYKAKESSYWIALRKLINTESKRLIPLDQIKHSVLLNVRDVLATPADVIVPISIPAMTAEQATALSKRMFSRTLDDMQEELYDDAE